MIDTSEIKIALATTNTVQEFIDQIGETIKTPPGYEVMDNYMNYMVDLCTFDEDEDYH